MKVLLRAKSGLAGLAVVLSSVGFAAPPAKNADMGIGDFEVGLLRNGELQSYVDSEVEKLSLFVMVTATSKALVDSRIDGRVMDVVATQGGKEIGRAKVDLVVGEYMTGKRRFIFTFTGKLDACEPVVVQAVITGQAKKAVKSVTIPTACGD